MRKRMLSLLVAHVLLLGLLPMRVAADELSSAIPSDEEQVILEITEMEFDESIDQALVQNDNAPVDDNTTSNAVDVQQVEEDATIPELEPEPESEQEMKPTVILDDVNRDGIFDVTDVMLLSQYLVGFDVTIDETAADVDCDENITVVDLILMKQHLAE